MSAFMTGSGVAVVVMLSRKQNGVRQMLLQRRRNTGFGDGMWDFACAGHVERGERMTEACARECREELGIKAAPENFNFFTLIYKKDGNSVYCNPYFFLTKYEGEPKIKEPFKCSELKWFDIDALPDDLLDDRKRAFEAFKKGEPFLEYGWEGRA